MSTAKDVIDVVWISLKISAEINILSVDVHIAALLVIKKLHQFELPRKFVGNYSSTKKQN